MCQREKHDSHQMLYRLNDTPYTKPKTASIGASNSDSKPKEISLQIKKRDADTGALLSEQPSYSTVTGSMWTKQQQEMMELQRSLIAERSVHPIPFQGRKKRYMSQTGMNCLKNSKRTNRSIKAL